jgi:hypothetical protein
MKDMLLIVASSVSVVTVNGSETGLGADVLFFIRARKDAFLSLVSEVALY